MKFRTKLSEQDGYNDASALELKALIGAFPVTLEA
jgi:hypothetical protein